MPETFRGRLSILGKLWWPSVLAATQVHFTKTYSDRAPKEDPDLLILGETGDFSEVIDYELVDLDTDEVIKPWDSKEHEFLWVDIMFANEF